MLEELQGPGGVCGFRAVIRSGAEVRFQTGPQRQNKIAAGPVKAAAESVLAVKRDGLLSGMVLGGTSLLIEARPHPARGDFEFAIPAGGKLWTTPIHRPIDTVRIAPEQNVFTDRVEVSFDIPTQEISDIEFRYTLDGSDPTLQSKLYIGPLTITETTRVKVRPFRKGLKRTPWNIPGVEAGKTVWATFRKEKLRPAVNVARPRPGLAYEYFEADWPARSRDGIITGRQRHPSNPIIAPTDGQWDEDICSKPFAAADRGRWLLWYNGRSGSVEQIGLAIREGEDLGF